MAAVERHEEAKPEHLIRQSLMLSRTETALIPTRFRRNDPARMEGAQNVLIDIRRNNTAAPIVAQSFPQSFEPASLQYWAP